MRIAPELYLKRLTVGGIESVFEINRNFRNEGISTQHNPEFTMLEFYWAYADYNDLMTLTEEMLPFVARTAIGTDDLTFGDHAISLTPPFRRLSLREAAREAAGKAPGNGRPGRHASLPRGGRRAGVEARRRGCTRQWARERSPRRFSRRSAKTT